MKVIKKINNNIAIAVDNEQHEVIVFGKGVGFGTIPYEIKDLSKIERTFYDIDEKYYGLLKEIPNNLFLLISKMVDVAKRKINGNINPNLVFILADHINFSITRDQKGMKIVLPYSYELEYNYPKLTNIAKWMVKTLNDKLHVHLDKGEVTSITMHLINALEGAPKETVLHTSANKVSKVIASATSIIETDLQFEIDRKSFNYFRFKNHLNYFVQRKENMEMFSDNNEELYQNMINEYPRIYACVSKIDDYFMKEFHERCTNEEKLYLMIHVNRLYVNEDCNRKGITP